MEWLYKYRLRKFFTTRLIDSRNKAFWTRCKSKYSISFLQSSDDIYEVNTTLKTATFYIPFDRLCIDSFTHEILHVYLKTEGINPGIIMSKEIRSDYYLNGIYNSYLLEAIGNCLDHVKMLPLYINAGFTLDKFLYDFEQEKCTNSEIEIIRDNINNRFHWHMGANHFVGKYLAIKSCPNEQYADNYNRYLALLQSINPALYSILETFWSSWLYFDITDKNNITKMQYTICHTFVNNLRQWTTDFENK